jgi:hypothetical protein
MIMIVWDFHTLMPQGSMDEASQAKKMKWNSSSAVNTLLYVLYIKKPPPFDGGF